MTEYVNVSAGACGADGCLCVVYRQPIGGRYAATTRKGLPRCQGVVRTGMNARASVLVYQCSRAGAGPFAVDFDGTHHHLCAQHEAARPDRLRSLD